MECYINWLNSNSGFVIAVTTIVYAFFTGLMVLEMYKTRKSEFRPYIIIDLEINDKIINIVIQNIGKGAAKDVTFSFNKSLKRSNNEDFSKKGFLLNGFSFFPPGKKFISFFDSSVEYFGVNKEIPKYEVTISYKNNITKDIYQERYIIDLSPHKDREYVI